MLKSKFWFTRLHLVRSGSRTKIRDCFESPMLVAQPAPVSTGERSQLNAHFLLGAHHSHRGVEAPLRQVHVLLADHLAVPAKEKCLLQTN